MELFWKPENVEVFFYIFTLAIEGWEWSEREESCEHQFAGPRTSDIDGRMSIDGRKGEGEAKEGDLWLCGIELLSRWLLLLTYRFQLNIGMIGVSLAKCVFVRDIMIADIMPLGLAD